MSDFAWKVPKGDERPARLSVTVGSALQDLDGYTVTISALGRNTGTVISATMTQTGAATEAGPTLTAAMTTVPDFYDVAFKAARASFPGPWTAIGTLEVVDHP